MDGATWIAPLLEAAPDAISEAAETLASHRDLTFSATSTLALVGNLVANGIRRRMLLKELQATGWNLRHASDRLRLGYGTGNILRAIRDLGLSDEYERIKAEGKVQILGRKKRSLVAEMVQRPAPKP
jgi:hypothetical protein